MWQTLEAWRARLIHDPCQVFLAPTGHRSSEDSRRLVTVILDDECFEFLVAIRCRFHRDSPLFCTGRLAFPPVDTLKWSVDLRGRGKPTDDASLSKAIGLSSGIGCGDNLQDFEHCWSSFDYRLGTKGIYQSSL